MFNFFNKTNGESWLKNKNDKHLKMKEVIE
jgi:hypothetical protein